MIFRGERVAGVDVFELRHRADVAGAQLRDRNLLLALQQLQLSDALFVIARRVPVRRVGLQRSGENAEQRHAAGERIGERLEHERGRERLGAAVERDRLTLRVFSFDRLHLVR